MQSGCEQIEISSASRRWARIAWGFCGLVLLVGVIGAIDRGIDNDPDWRDLHFETNWTWQHGHTAPGTTMFGYLPTTTFALWPFTTWLPQPLGVLLYIATNVAAMAVSVWLLYRWWGDSSQRTGGSWSIDIAFVVAMLLGVVNLAHAIQSNQTTLWTLVLCVGGLTLVGLRRDFAGGLLIGLAAMIKVMPGLLAVYLLLRRRWWALGGVVVAGIVFNIVPSVLFFGWHGTIDEHRAWLRRAGWHSSQHLIDRPLLRVHRHGTNASLATVLTRWLRGLPDVREQVILYGDPPDDVVARYRANLPPDVWLTIDPMPPRDGSHWAEKRVDITWVPRFHIADLPPDVIKVLWAAPLVVAFVLLAWFTARTAGRADDDWPVVSALWMLAMFWPSPMTRHYYLAWALPALVVVARVLLAGGPRGHLVGLAAVIAWILGIAFIGSKVVRWYGIHVFSLLVLTLATAWAWRVVLRRTRRPSTPTFSD